MLIKAEADADRIDNFIFGILGEKFHSRANIQRMIKKGEITLNGAAVKPSSKIRAGDEIFVPEESEPESCGLEPAEMELDIVYEDGDILIINKAPGQIVHPGISHKNDTIANALIKRYRDLPVIGGTERPGIVHRLDKDTSGLLMIALNEKAYYALIAAQKKREIEKTYWGIVHGEPKNREALIDIPIGRSPSNRKLFKVGGVAPKEAKTEFRMLRTKGGLSLVEFRLITGRTHQIRVHMRSIGHPIVGDLDYGRKDRHIVFEGKEYGFTGHLLCAKKLQFKHPTKGTDIKIEIDPPFRIEGLV